ncbi:MAG: hypothetical protein HYR63_08650 [Proteobacteria bacterium]|nr:hypothetical protein [Pseudomonadota bacterium]
MRCGVWLYPQRGHRLPRQVVTAGRARGPGDINMMPPCDRECCGLDADGNVATTQTGRSFDMTGSLVAAEMMSCRPFDDHPARPVDDTFWCEVPEHAVSVLRYRHPGPSLVDTEGPEGGILLVTN